MRKSSSTATASSCRFRTISGTAVAALALLLLAVLTTAPPAAEASPIGQLMMTQRRAAYWPGMWDFEPQPDDLDDAAIAEKRGYYWPGMWHFDRNSRAEKRAYFWPGMWRHQQRTPRLAKRSYEFYWLGKACGETGDIDACNILNGMYY